MLNFSVHEEVTPVDNYRFSIKNEKLSVVLKPPPPLLVLSHVPGGGVGGGWVCSRCTRQHNASGLPSEKGLVNSPALLSFSFFKPVLPKIFEQILTILFRF